MADNTKIEWTDATLNPIRARNRATGKVGWFCTHESPGCANCYAESMNIWRGTGLPFKPGHRDDIEIFMDQKMLLQPYRWYRPRKIFICSMTDLFGDFIDDDMIDQMFGMMAICSHHAFQVLTKRPARMERYFRGFEQDGEFHEGFRDALIEGAAQSLYAGLHHEDPSLWLAVHAPLPNVLLGCSVEDQRRADERREPMRVLAELGWKTWVSYEPALENVDWKGWEFLSWMVSGGESGKGARPSHPDWHREARDFCAWHGIPFLFKQWGEWHVPNAFEGRENIGPTTPFVRVGKKLAGRLLDGVEHNGYPK